MRFVMSSYELRPTLIYLMSFASVSTQPINKQDEEELKNPLKLFKTVSFFYFQQMLKEPEYVF